MILVGLSTCLTVDPMINAVKRRASDATFDSVRYEQIIEQVSRLNVDMHVRDHAVYNMADMVATLNSSVSGCPLASRAPKMKLLDEIRMMAVHAVLKGSQLARLPVLLWADTYTDWKSNCYISSKVSTIQFMLPFDHVVSTKHLALFYV